MRIQKVEHAKKHQVAVVVDGEKYYFDIDVWMLSGYRENVEITENQLETLVYQSDFTRAKSKAVWLLSRQDYTRKQLFDKLKGDFAETAICEALDWLHDNGLQDDLSYAERLAQDCIKNKKLAPFAIKFELQKRGISREDAEGIVSLIEENFNPQEQIEELLKQKYRKALTDENERRRAFAALMRRGYSFSDIKTALNLLIDEEF
jgi:regulatory protein